MESPDFPCPVDGVPTKILFSDVRDYEVHKGEGPGFTVRWCDSCQIGFTTPKLTFQELAPYYPSSYEAYRPRTGILNFIQKIKFRSDIRRIAKLTGKSSVFEVGAGRGEFLNELKISGFTCAGSEPSTFGRQYAQDHFGISLVASFESELHFTEKYDVIIMKHVLEHTNNPHDFLSRIKHEALTTKGAVYIKVPNLNSMEAKLFGAFWSGLDVPRHLWHFTPAGISRIAKEAGYSKVTVKNEVVFSDFLRSMTNASTQTSGVKGLLLRLLMRTPRLLLILPFQLVAYILFIATKRAGRMIIIARP